MVFNINEAFLLILKMEQPGNTIGWLNKSNPGIPARNASLFKEGKMNGRDLSPTFVGN
jgi:hypothetical protein